MILRGVINIRLFTVAGDESALVMDSLGLHIFGLPDVQCHFRDREPAEIAALLHSTATYLFDAGDVIADGNTISSLDGVEDLRVPPGTRAGRARSAGAGRRSR